MHALSRLTLAMLICGLSVMLGGCTNPTEQTPWIKGWVLSQTELEVELGGWGEAQISINPIHGWMNDDARLDSVVRVQGYRTSQKYNSPNWGWSFPTNRRWKISILVPMPPLDEEPPYWFVSISAREHSNVEVEQWHGSQSFTVDDQGRWMANKPLVSRGKRLPGPPGGP